MMVLELKLSKSRFILRESIKVQVSIRNTGGAPIQVAAISDNRNTALRYTLEGPSFEEPFTFDYGGPNAFRIPGDPAMETVDPGGELSRPVTVQQYWKAWKPGKHSLRAALGEDVQSAAVQFEILEPEVLSAQVLVDQAPSLPAFMRVLFLAKAGKQGPPVLYQGFFPEVRPDVELTPEGNIMQVAAAEASARETAGTWTSGFDRSSLFFARFGLTSEDGNLQVQELDSPLVTVRPPAGSVSVRPAYLLESGDLLWLTLAGTQATLWQIPRGESGPGPSALWTADLPFAPAAHRFTFTANPAEGDRFAAIFFGEKPRQEGSEEDPTVLAALVDQQGQLVETLEAPKARLIPNSEPALFVDARGAIRASILLMDPEDPQKLWVSEWTREPDAAGKSPLTRPATCTVPVPPAASAVIYGPPLANPRRDWVVLLEDGLVVTNRNPDGPRELEGKVVLPMQLLPRVQMTYLLLTHPAEVVYLAPMF